MLTMENTFTEYPDIVSPKQMLHIGRNKAFEFLKGDIGNTAVGKRDMARIDVISNTYGELDYLQNAVDNH
ncbi:MAG: hypothetical protein IJY19_11425 [Ruminococcus sp.]|nr:hypothetical protein [Ruminococcus sp.]